MDNHPQKDYLNKEDLTIGWSEDLDTIEQDGLQPLESLPESYDVQTPGGPPNVSPADESVPPTVAADAVEKTDETPATAVAAEAKEEDNAYWNRRYQRHLRENTHVCLTCLI